MEFPFADYIVSNSNVNVTNSWQMMDFLSTIKLKQIFFSKLFLVKCIGLKKTLPSANNMLNLDVKACC